MLVNTAIVSLMPLASELPVHRSADIAGLGGQQMRSLTGLALVTSLPVPTESAIAGSPLMVATKVATGVGVGHVRIVGGTDSTMNRPSVQESWGLRSNR